MFERFTDRARRVVVLAQDEARALGHSEIGTEHLLLGLIQQEQEGGVAFKALHSLELSYEGVLGRVEDARPRGAKIEGSKHLPFISQAKKALELALREALGLGHNYIGTEHLLLGLIREGEGLAAHILVGSGLSLGQTRQVVLRILFGDEPEPPAEEAPYEESTILLNQSETELLEKAHERFTASIERYKELLAQSDALGRHLSDMIREDEKTRDLLRIAIARREQ